MNRLKLKNKMSKKILYFHSQIVSQFGGAEYFIDNFIKNSLEYQHLLIGSTKSWQQIFTNNKQPIIKTNHGFEPVTIKHILLSPISFLLCLISFIKNYKTIKNSDIIMVHLPPYTELYFMLIWVEIFCPKQVVFMVHRNCSRAITRNPLSFILKYFWQKYPVIFNSQSSLNSFVKSGIKPAKPVVINNGTIIPQETNFNETTKRNRSRLKIGYLSRIDPKKGLQEILQILTEKIDQVELPIELYIGGDGVLKEQLQKKYTSSSNFKIFWLGYVTNKKDFYSNIDLSIFPSKEESFGISMVESWSFGIPVLSSNIDTFLEIKSVSPQLEQSLMFDLYNPSEFIEKLNFFIRNIEEYQSIKYRNDLLAVVKKYFDLQKNILKYKEVLENSL